MLDLYSNKVVGPSGDIWALGCALYFLCFQKHPFEDAEVLAIINGKYRMPSGGPYEKFFDLIGKLLALDPANRPVAPQILEYLKQLGASIPGDQRLPLSKMPVQEDAATGRSSRGFIGRMMGGAQQVLDQAKHGARMVVAQKDTKVHGGNAQGLDLTYITPKLICMAGPSDSMVATNPTSKVKAYFDMAHPGEVAVINVGEKDSYNTTGLGYSFVQKGWLKGTAPPLATLYVLCMHIQGQYDKGKRNVVAVHCAKGKAESGTVIAAYFVYCSLASSADDAMRLFHMKRMVNNKPVITPSQVRYIQYIQKIVAKQIPHKRSLRIRRLILQSIPVFNTKNNGCRPFAEIIVKNKVAHSTRASLQGTSIVPEYKHDNGGVIVLDLNQELIGDVQIVVYHESVSLIGQPTVTEMFAFSFHTGFVDGSGLELQRHEIDGVKGSKFDRNFAIRLEAEVGQNNLEKPPVWEKHPCTAVGSSSAFTSQKEYAEFMSDFASSSHSYSDRSTSVDNLHRESNVTLSDDEEMMDGPQQVPSETANPPAPTGGSLLDFNAPQASGQVQPARAGSLLDFGRSSQPPPQTANDLFSFSSPAPATTAQPAAGLQDLFGGPAHSSQPAQPSGGLLDMFGQQPTQAPPVTSPPPQAQHQPLTDLFGNLTTAPTPQPPTQAAPSNIAMGNPMVQPTKAASQASTSSGDVFGDLFAAQATPQSNAASNMGTGGFNLFGNTQPAPAPSMNQAAANQGGLGSLGGLTFGTINTNAPTQPMGGMNGMAGSMGQAGGPNYSGFTSSFTPAATPTPEQTPTRAQPSSAKPPAKKGLAGFADFNPIKKEDTEKVRCCAVWFFLACSSCQLDLAALVYATVGLCSTRVW